MNNSAGNPDRLPTIIRGAVEKELGPNADTEGLTQRLLNAIYSEIVVQATAGEMSRGMGHVRMHNLDHTIVNLGKAIWDERYTTAEKDHERLKKMYGLAEEGAE